ncbi:MAG: hypothetical protein QOE69_1311 [Thermoleophilaceae bacterium]|jgi:Lrp/AsnC family transcriptional regulator for asnA, asnC and gidA|nr:hypothetical protein [Thermoleophilaceae bacterium]MEA2407192.1 hypothetical protein [Thermoleophilaceae bacterium]
MAPHALSETEQEIVKLLQEDGRLTFVAISRALGIPEPTARRTVYRLLDEGLIDVTAVANPRFVGLEAMAVVGIAVDWARVEGRLQAQMLEIRGVDYVATTSGRFQIMAEVMARDPMDLGSRVDLIRELDGVRSTETFVYLDLLHQDFRWNATSGPGSVESQNRPEQISGFERQLVLALYEDGRRSFRQIARDLDASLQRVTSAYGRLTTKGILRVMAVVNPSSLGIETMAWLGVRVRAGAKVRTVAEALVAVPEVDYVVTCTGRFDILVEASCTDSRGLAEVIETRVGPADGVGIVEAFTYLRLDYPTERVWSAGRVSALNLDA